MREAQTLRTPETHAAQRANPAPLLAALLAWCLVGVGCSPDSASSDGSSSVTDGASSLDVAPPDVSSDVTAPSDAGPSTPGLGIDYDANPGASPRFEPAGTDWTARPWPSDSLRAADGTVDLSTLPNPDDVDILSEYLAYGMEELRGFGLNSSVYFQFDGALSTNALPTADQTLRDARAPIQLVNATKGSARYAERIPLEFYFYDAKGEVDPYYAGPNVLAMRPVFGFPLAEGDVYCALVTRAVRDASGGYLKRPAAFTEALADDASLQPLNTWLADSQLVADDVAVATCFTTDRPTQQLLHIREHLDTLPLPEVTALSYTGKAGFQHEIQGIYLAPNFQAGDKPYDFAGGELQFDAAGDPIVQALEPIRFKLLVPTLQDMPDGGWPIVIYAHGTGGDWSSCYSVSDELLSRGLAMVCIDQPLHGARSWTANPSEINLILFSFNFLNPRAGRSNFRQSAIDSMMLARMIAEGGLDVAAAETTYGKDVRYDPGLIGFFGHSHGGLSGALVLGVDPLIQAGLLSGAGGVLIETILKRKDLVDIEALVVAALGVPNSTFNSHHPTLTTIQTIVDATDPINYAPYWFGPAAGGFAKHVFMTEGEDDGATPAGTTDALAAAGRVPVMIPVAHDSIPHQLRDLPYTQQPLSINVSTTQGDNRTAGLRQWPSPADHFVAFTAEAIPLWRTFFRTMARGLPPVIDNLP